MTPVKKGSPAAAAKAKAKIDKLMIAEESRFKEFMNKKPTHAQIIARIKRIATGKGVKSGVKFYVMLTGLSDLHTSKFKKIKQNLNKVRIDNSYLIKQSLKDWRMWYIINAMSKLERESGLFNDEGKMVAGKFNISKNKIDEFNEKIRSDVEMQKIKAMKNVPSPLPTFPLPAKKKPAKKAEKNKNVFNNSHWNNTVWANQQKRNRIAIAQFRMPNAYLDRSSEKAFNRNFKKMNRMNYNIHSPELYGIETIYPPVSFKNKNGRWKTIEQLSKERNEKGVTNTTRYTLQQRQAKARIARMGRYLKTLPKNHKIFRLNDKVTFEHMNKMLRAAKNEKWFETFKNWVATHK